MGTYYYNFFNPDHPDPDHNKWFMEYHSDYPSGYNKWMGGLDPEMHDKEDHISTEEMENIEKFLEGLDNQINPPDLDDDGN